MEYISLMLLVESWDVLIKVKVYATLSIFKMQYKLIDLGAPLNSVTVYSISCALSAYTCHYLNCMVSVVLNLISAR